MSERGPGGIRDRPEAREELARGDGRLVELERSQRRLQHLYDISKLLARFQSVERTIPTVVSVIAKTLPLRSATLILETGGAPRTVTWQAAGESARRLRVAQAHAQEMYGYLIHSRVEFDREEASILEISPPPAAPEAEAEAKQSFVMLPCAVGHRSVFGALQIESARELEERDLLFVEAIVNQLAIALDRYSSDRDLRASESRLAGIISIAAEAII
jgi:transcriptional regulator with GAF, ATPase, and Fis domain